MFSTYLYPQYVPENPTLGGWALNTVPPTVDVIALDPVHLPALQDINVRLNGTIARHAVVWVQRGAMGLQMSIAVTPRLGPVTPYGILHTPSHTPCIYLDRQHARYLQSGDRVLITWWERQGKAHTREWPVEIVQGPEVGFPAGLLEDPVVFDDLLQNGIRGPLVGYFPPLSGADQSRLERVLNRPARLPMDAGWVRWGPSPVIVMEALMPAGSEALLEDAQWSVGVMARVSHDVPYAVWIGRDVKYMPYPDVHDSWITHEKVVRPESPTWTLPFVPPFGVNVLEPFTVTQPLWSEPWRGPRSWPGIVLQSPSVYEEFQGWMTMGIARNHAQLRDVPIRWGQPDPAPVIEAIQHGYRFVVAFRQWDALTQISALTAETQQVIQRGHGRILDLAGWVRGYPQWL